MGERIPGDRGRGREAESISIYIYLHMHIYVFLYTHTHTHRHMYVYVCVYLAQRADSSRAGPGFANADSETADALLVAKCWARVRHGPGRVVPVLSCEQAQCTFKLLRRRWIGSPFDFPPRSTAAAPQAELGNSEWDRGV